MSNRNRTDCPHFYKAIAEAVFFSLAEEFCEEAENTGKLLSHMNDESAFSLQGARDLGAVRGSILAMSGKLHAMRQLSHVIAEAAASAAVEDSLSEVLRLNQRLLNELTELELSATIAFQGELGDTSPCSGSGSTSEEARLLHELLSLRHPGRGEGHSHTAALSSGTSVYVLICAGEDIPEQLARNITARIAPIIGKVVQEEYEKQRK